MPTNDPSQSSNDNDPVQVRGLEKLIQEIAVNSPSKLEDISTESLVKEYSIFSESDIDKEREAWWPRCKVYPEGATHQNAKLTCAWNMPWEGDADIEWKHDDPQKIAHRCNKHTVTETEVSREEYLVDNLTPDVKFLTDAFDPEEGVIVEVSALDWLPLGDPQMTATWLHKVADKTRRYLTENWAVCWVFAPTTPALSIKPAAEAVLEHVTRYDNISLGLVNPEIGGAFNPGVVIRRQDHLLFERAGSGFNDEFVYLGS